MVRAWYPPALRGAADRLRFYAAHFDTVEVDSTFYALPNPFTARLWAERTPPGFVLHVKAFGLLTKHGIRPQQLPGFIRSEHGFELDTYGRILHPTAELRERAFALFREGLEPLRESGKLGVILMQFPPYFVASEPNRQYLVESVNRLAPDRAAVEFRHVSWLAPRVLDDTLDMLRSLGACFVSVDAPRVSSPNALPPLTALTSDIAYVRFHGRNAATWNARVGSAAERFRYLYTEEELAEWVEPVRHLQEQAGTVYLMFNNCYADYAPRNAQQMLSLLTRPSSRDRPESEAPHAEEERPRGPVGNAAC